jgi:hypothetical protein
LKHKTPWDSNDVTSEPSGNSLGDYTLQFPGSTITPLLKSAGTLFADQKTNHKKRPLGFFQLYLE